MAGFATMVVNPVNKNVKDTKLKKLKVLIAFDNGDKKDPDQFKRFSTEFPVDNEHSIPSLLRSVGEALLEQL